MCQNADDNKREMERVWCINSIYKRNQQSTNLNTKKRGKESLKKKQQNTPVQTNTKQLQNSIFGHLVHVNSLNSFSASEDYGMILIFRLPFT